MSKRLLSYSCLRVQLLRAVEVVKEECSSLTVYLLYLTL